MHFFYHPHTAVILPTKFPQVSQAHFVLFCHFICTPLMVNPFLSPPSSYASYSCSLESASPGRASCSTVLLVLESLFLPRLSPPKPTPPSSPCPPRIWCPNGKERVRSWSSRCSRWPARPSPRLSSSMRLIPCAQRDRKERVSPRDVSRRNSSCR